MNGGPISPDGCDRLARPLLLMESISVCSASDTSKNSRGMSDRTATTTTCS